MTKNVPARVKPKSIRVNTSTEIEERRESVSRLAFSQRLPPKKIAQILGVTVGTVNSDIQFLRKNQQVLVAQTGESGMPAENVMSDIMAASNQRIKLLWDAVEDLQETYETLIGNLRSWDGATMGEKSDEAHAMKSVLTTVRGLLKDIREEEEHQVKTLKRLGVVSETSKVDQKVTVQDNTPLVKVVADFINNEVKDPAVKRRLQHALQERIRSRSELTG